VTACDAAPSQPAGTHDGTAETGAGPASVPAPIRVLLCAAHEHVLWGLDKLVAGEWPRALVIGAVASLADAERVLRSHTADVVVLDCIGATEATLIEVDRLRRSYAASIVALGADASALDGLRRSGVSTVVPLDAPAARILDAICQTIEKQDDVA
jgi:DNA-binding NarL/FixJ family response regulator